MADPAATDKPRLPLRPHQVWAYDRHEGYRRSIESAGSVAAPLLAGFTLALLGLIVPSLGAERQTVTTADGLRIVTEEEPFSRAPEVAAALLLVAGLLLIFCVQAAVAMRRHDHAVADIRELWPQHFPQSVEGDVDQPDVPADLKGWEHTARYENAVPVRVGTQWYSGFVRSFMYSEWAEADKNADRTRNLYHAGITALLGGLIALVLPPDGAGTPERWALVAVAVAGFLAEAVWIWRVSALRKRLAAWRERGRSAT